MSTSPVKLLFGAGGIGEGIISHTWTTGEQTSELLEILKELGLTQLDSAASYPPGSAWVTERLLGESGAVKKGFVVDTKILVGDLSEKGIDESIKKSLELLGVEQVNTLCSHVPDKKVPVEESARAFDKHYRLGHFIHDTTTPSHAISRHPEEQLYPLLRKHGVKIITYGPLAGGFLTGKVTRAKSSAANIDLSGGRWDEGRFPIYQQTFDKPAAHDAMLKFCQKYEDAGMTPTEVSLRWIMNHSFLQEGDGIIFGATKVEQLRGNVELCKKGPLNAEMVGACDELR